MSARSFESSASSKDLSMDCLKNYDIKKQLKCGVSSEIYLATCKRGRLKRRAVVLKKVNASGRIQDSVAVHQALCHPTILTLFSTLPATDSDLDEGDPRPQTQFGTPTITATPKYLVLEYCGPHGTLADYIPRLNPASSTSPLGESRIRGVVKTLADALVHLEKENVVHRRLVPESVYVTEDFRVKLGGFEGAVRISPDGSDGCVGVLSMSAAEAGVPQYHLAPEIKAGLCYACPSDLWSFGLLILWMLDQSREVTSNLHSVCMDREGELGALVSQLLEKIPERRIKARNVSGHPFLDPQLPVRNLDPNPGSGPHSNPTLNTSYGSEERRNEAIRPTLRKLHGLEMGLGKQKQKPFNVRYPLHDLGSDSGHTGYRSQFPHAITAPRPSTLLLPPRAAEPNRRVVSDPVHGTNERRKFLDPIEEAVNEYGDDEGSTSGPRARFRSKTVTAVLPSFLQPHSRTPTTGDGDSHDQVEDSLPESSVGTLGMEGLEKSLMQTEGEKAKDVDDGMNEGGLLGDFGEAFHGPLPFSTLRPATTSDPIHRIKSILDTFVPESHSTPAASKSSVTQKHVSSSPPSPSPPSGPSYGPINNPPEASGIGVPRPKPFDTSFLPPQTQKVARGQLVVLPSKTLLVDFREGERRQGRQGVEVLTVSPDGEEISVFSAPHMSSPCCLVEPSVTYKLGDLPKSYWKLYVDAGKLVEQIKQHIPRLVLYESDSKFTLMANFPDADIEAVFYAQDGRSGVQPNEGGEIPDKKGGFPLRGAVMRIKFMRDRQLVEMSRQILAPTSRDRVMKPSSKNSPLPERGEWKKVVLVAPGGNIDAIDRTSFDEYERNGFDRTKGFLAVCGIIELGLVEVGALSRGAVSCDPTSPSPIPIHKALPVGQHNSSAPKESESIDLMRKLGRPKPSVTTMTSTTSMGWNRGFPFDPPSLIQQPGSFETRFIPSVGWCVRHASLSGGAGRYRMMFFDGKTLEVDVDEECVEMMDSVRDEIVRYKIRDCSSKREIMEKMWAFKEFVSMFDDSSDVE